MVSFTLPENAASRRVMDERGLSYRGLASWNDRRHVWYDLRYRP